MALQLFRDIEVVVESRRHRACAAGRGFDRLFAHDPCILSPPWPQPRLARGWLVA
ncbi:hypothetical protein ACFPRL_05600 [Pseudoclavibacter helvolus]